jgi:hypothetical protein
MRSAPFRLSASVLFARARVTSSRTTHLGRSSIQRDSVAEREFAERLAPSHGALTRPGPRAIMREPRP